MRGSRFEVAVTVRFLKLGAFDAQGLVTVPVAYLIRKVGILSAAQIKLVESAVCHWLGIRHYRKPPSVHLLPLDILVRIKSTC